MLLAASFAQAHEGASGIAGIFFVLGALANGLTIAVLGWLMEISPDARRRAYSGYFNALTALDTAYLLPLLGGLFVVALGSTAVFALAAIGAAAQWAFVRSTNTTGSAAS